MARAGVIARACAGARARGSTCDARDCSASRNVASKRRVFWCHVASWPVGTCERGIGHVRVLCTS